MRSHYTHTTATVYPLKSCLLMLVMLLVGCYAHRIGEKERHRVPAPAEIQRIFDRHSDGKIIVAAEDPGEVYRFDPSEKDVLFAKDSAASSTVSSPSNVVDFAERWNASSAAD